VNKRVVRQKIDRMLTCRLEHVKKGRLGSLGMSSLPAGATASEGHAKVASSSRLARKISGRLGNLMMGSGSCEQMLFCHALTLTEQKF